MANAGWASASTKTFEKNPMTTSALITRYRAECDRSLLHVMGSARCTSATIAEHLFSDTEKWPTNGNWLTMRGVVRDWLLDHQHLVAIDDDDCWYVRGARRTAPAFLSQHLAVVA